MGNTILCMINDNAEYNQPTNRSRMYLAENQIMNILKSNHDMFEYFINEYTPYSKFIDEDVYIDKLMQMTSEYKHTRGSLVLCLSRSIYKICLLYTSPSPRD